MYVAKKRKPCNVFRHDVVHYRLYSIGKLAVQRNVNRGQPKLLIVINETFTSFARKPSSLFWFVVSHAFLITFAVYGGMVNGNPTAVVIPTEFVFMSDIGGMVGGSSSISNSTYVSRSGLVQVSKEESNGVLHTLMMSQADTNELFNYVAKSCGLDDSKKPNVNSEDDVLSEYYPPTRFIAYFFLDAYGSFYDYGNQAGQPKLGKVLENSVSRLLAKTTLYSAKSGLYVRAQRLSAENLHLIGFDLTLDPSELSSYPKLKRILANEMAMVEIPENSGAATLDNVVALRPGNNLHIRLGGRPYVIFTYRYNGQPER